MHIIFKLHQDDCPLSEVTTIRILYWEIRIQTTELKMTYKIMMVEKTNY